jgi:Tfp pilus assembly protein PilO
MNNEKPLENGREQIEETEILTNDLGTTRDDAVVIDEPGRTVMLTEDETIIVSKEPKFPIAPKDRPRKVYSGMWGQTEIAIFAVALLVVLSVILFYIFIVAPSSNELEQNRARRDDLEKELAAAKTNYGDITDTETHVAKLAASVDDFEVRYLPSSANGRTSLYQRINGLIGAYGLTNTNGPTYAPLELADIDQNNQSDAERGRARFRSLFPGMYITMTVEGSYQNLRRFIREVETGNEFVIISSVELAPSESSGTAAAETTVAPAETYINPITGMPEQTIPQPAQPRGRTHGERVALRLEMAAYFQRENRAIETELQ